MTAKRGMVTNTCPVCGKWEISAWMQSETEEEEKLTDVCSDQDCHRLVYLEKMLDRLTEALSRR